MKFNVTYFYLQDAYEPYQIYYTNMLAPPFANPGFAQVWYWLAAALFSVKQLTVQSQDDLQTVCAADSTLSAL